MNTRVEPSRNNPQLKGIIVNAEQRDRIAWRARGNQVGAEAMTQDNP